MSLKVLLLLVLQPVNGIIDGEDVLGVKRLLDILHKVDCSSRHNALHESLSDLANTVMVREAAALLEDLISALIFDLLVHLDDLILGNASVGVVVAEVDIYSCTGLVDLGHSEGDEEALFLDAAVFAGLDQSFSDLLAEGAHLAPGARSLEGLSNVAMLSSEIADIGDGESQEIAFQASL